MIDGKTQGISFAAVLLCCERTSVSSNRFVYGEKCFERAGKGEEKGKGKQEVRDR